MRIQRSSWVLCVLTIIASVIGVHEARAQSYPYTGPSPTPGFPGLPPHMQPGMPGPAADGPSFAPQYAPGSPMGPAVAPMGYAPTGYGTPLPPQAPYGHQGVGYYDPQQGAIPQPLVPSPATAMDGPIGQGLGPYPDMPTDWCGYCGGHGCDFCMGGHDDFDFNLLRRLLPYAEAGCGAPRWYDITADWVFLKRDSITQNPAVFASSGILGPPVLGTDDLRFAETSGFRAGAAIQLGAGNSLETTFLGQFNWASRAEVNDPNNLLFSVISNFGDSPFLGFDDTDRASHARIEYSSSFDNIELNYRQRWMEPNARVQGSWLVGARFLYLEEDFRYATNAPANPGWMDYLVGTSNALTGAQLGGDLWVCIIPGLNVGGEAKVGIYGNRATQRTRIDAYSFAEPVHERVTTDGAAFLGDANLSLLWRINQQWSFRSGYMFLWMTEVALAPDNFNAGPPFVTDQRTPFINSNGEAFYHGFMAGFEYLW
jgi:hypothetical protein